MTYTYIESQSNPDDEREAIKWCESSSIDPYSHTDKCEYYDDTPSDATMDCYIYAKQWMLRVMQRRVEQAKYLESVNVFNSYCD